MTKHKFLAALALALVATVGAVPTSWAATKSSAVRGYIFAWRQWGPKTLLVAYRAKNGTTVAQRGVCTVDAKPTFKLAKPGFYSFAPQVFSLAHASSKFTYIGAFSLAPSPAVIKIERVWVKCS
jgi:hypothetical protein